MDLISTESLVESPFIIAQIGGFTFGSYTASSEKLALGKTMHIDYPNYMKSLQVTKINGQVNLYTLQISYAITQFDDPNMFEKIFSQIRDNREMILTYGDWNAPAHIYREEKTLITTIKNKVSINASRIEYTIQAVSTALSLNSAKYDFPQRTAKVSDVIKELLFTPSYGLQDVFTGMINKTSVLTKNLIASDDKIVTIEAKSSSNVLDYLSHCLKYMASETNNTDSVINDSMYMMNIVDDVKNEYGGPYFEVRKVGSNDNISTSESAWEIDVGYPGQNFVTNFEIQNDETWSLFYDYQGEINQSNYVYRIDNEGNLMTEYSPSIARSRQLKITTEKNKNWWTQMTQYPISATLTIKGLVRPTILMDYVKLTVLFYGKKHISSGIYVITKQVDTINSSGYRTQLTLLRIKEDK
jgi:hypothetical protein